jgi:sensor domain CHASE-containing protein
MFGVEIIMSNGLTLKSLQEKVSLTLFVVIGALAVVSYVTLHEIVAPTFDRLEYEEARTNLVRAERAIQNDLDNLNAITGDWGLWDDAYDYVRGEYPAFEDSNLDRPTLTNLGLNLLAVYDAHGDLVWGQLQIDEQPDDVDRLGVLTGDTHTAEFLISHTDPAGQLSGLLRTDVGPMLFSSWPVVKSDGSGPIAGTMIMGQFLNDERIAAIRDRTEVQLTITPIDPVREVFEGLEVPLNISSSGSMLHTMTTNNVISTAMLADLFGEPLVLLDVQTPRNISALGNSTVDGALLFLALSAVIVAIVTWLLLRRIIVTPLARMADHIVAMRKSGDLSSRLDEDRGDEIGALSNEFDRLTDELDQARRLLLEQSFKAGKADTAAEVLHNIRNAMTPMINGIDRLSKNFDVTRRLKVKQALEELASGECPPERAAKMLQYLESAFSHIEASNEDAAENLAVASKQARHVEAILADQERHAKAAPVVEKLSIDEVLDEAVLVIPNDDVPSVALEFENDIHAVSVKAHRVSLLQVMGNIMLNAYESIKRSQMPEGRIDVSVCEEVVDERPMVRLTICDNGGGFDETTGEKIFQRGFSSKEGNLSGLGLHWCANALAGMGGRIDAVSDGPGRGAKFHVLLPAAQGGQV